MKKYSIVCYLEGESKQNVRDLQHKLFEITGSRKCLDSWEPHITLGSGINVVPEQQEKVDNTFEILSKNQNSLDVQLNGFGGTVKWGGASVGGLTPYVLWINADVNQYLMDLFNSIKEITDDYETWYPRIVEYIPHVTVAYGDLSEDGHKKGSEYLNQMDISDSISISHIALVENFPDKDIEYKRFYFR